MEDGQADEQPADRSVLRPAKDDSAFGNPEHDAQFRSRAGIAIKLAELDDEDLLDPRLRGELNRLVPDANWRPGLDLDSLRDQPPISIGRNDPCPCGSGGKFRRCHGDPLGPAPAA